MKATPTEYKGTLYRSKLEAKWAAYFDMCDAQFEYEPQAFELGNGVRYLPDFVVKNVYSVHGGCGSQTLENSTKYREFWFECKGVMSDYDAEKIKRFRDNITIWNEFGGFDCPFYVLDKTPYKMFCDDEDCGCDSFEFGPIDGDDDYGFLIAKPVGCKGLGLFGTDSNYRCWMDDKCVSFAFQTEQMFRWEPRR